MSIAEKIRQQRRLMSLSQEELAYRVGVSLKTVQRWEAEERSPRMGEITKLSEALNTPINTLIGTEEDESESILHTKQQSNNERSLNRGMLVFETQDGKRFEAPPTDIGMKYLERMLSLSMGNAVPSGV